MKSHASMNRIYRLVWNAALNLWVAVAENAKGRGKGGSVRSSVECSSAHQGDGGHGGDGGGSGFTLNVACKAAVGALASLFLLAPQANAADAANAAVVAGSGNVATAGNVTTINQSTQKLAIDWTSLSTRANEALVFNQPNASAIALNRIIGSSPSELLGSLTANGQVFILNPNGVLFGAGSQVNVGGLVASTLSMSNADFMAGNHVFSNNGSSGAVVNQGTLNATPGGYLALLAPEVRNEGVMTASLGTALLAAGNKVTLNLDNGSLLGYSIDQGAINALAENKQLIQANGGQVLLGAKALDSLTTATVNNTGVIEAKTIQNKAGRILLMGDMQYGTVNVGGTLDASAPTTGDGGFVETSAAHVKVADGAKISTLSDTGKTGTWLIDPTDFTVASGSVAQTTSGIGATTLSNNLANTSVTLATDNSSGTGNGDIHVNAAVSWSANTRLTLNAYNNINVNAAITATGASAGLELNHGNYAAAGSITSGTDYKVSAPITLSGGGATLAINGTGYTLIHSMAALDAIDSTGLGGNYAMAQDLDAGGSTYASALVSGTFTGTFAGLGHTISKLAINAGSSINVGLFGSTAASGVLRDVGLVGGSVVGTGTVGGLVGSNAGSISNAYATGSVSALRNVGGLVGSNTGSISGSYATGAVTGIDTGQPIDGLGVGGLAGGNSGSISNAYATGSVSGRTYVGGLVGSSGGNINNAYASGSVNGGTDVGGLVGLNGGSISDSHAGGAVAATVNYAGGLVGENSGNTGISGSHATGSVSSALYAGGLVGWNSGRIDMAYATGSVSGGGGGGLAGLNSGNIGNSYATGSVWGAGTVGGLVGLNAGSISNSYAGGSVTATGSYAGGLVGYNFGGSTISNAYATGDVSGVEYVGGLAGGNSQASISNANASGSVSGHNYVGGLVGNNNQATINNANASGSVTGNDSVGGLVGTNDTGYISNGYASGRVSGISNVGGMAGYVGGMQSFVSGYWDINSTGQARSHGGYGGGVTPILPTTLASVFSHNRYANLGTWSETASGSGIWVATDAGTGAKAWVMIEGSTRPFLYSEYSTNIQNAHQLQLMALDTSASYTLAGNINAGETGAGNTGGMWGTAGFVPVGNSAAAFSGSLDGQSHTISDLTINRAGTDYVGLFGSTGSTSVISNLGLTGSSISGATRVGALVGENDGASISNAYAIGSVSGSSFVGGLVGFNYNIGGSISNSYAAGSVSGSTSYTGGLVGSNNGSISNAYATGSVLGKSYLGGLVGFNAGNISNAYATGSVSGSSSSFGGLVGFNGGSIINAYATGDVSGGSLYLGGLVGDNRGSISNAYSSGAVSSLSYVGGLVGNNAGSIINAYATGSVSGSSVFISGLVGYNTGSISSSYWDSSSTGRSRAVGGGSGTATNVSAINSSSATSHGSYASLGTWAETASSSGVWVANDGSGNTWVMIEGSTRPFLYSEYSTNIHNAHQLQLMAVDTSASYALTANIDASETRGSNASGMWTTAGFVPVGNSTAAFAGNLDGQSHTIADLNINRAGTDYVGLFGRTSAASVISNLGLAGGSVSGANHVGGLAGDNGGSISNSYASVAVSGTSRTGGLAGDNTGSIADSYASGAVSAAGGYSGGLVGYNGTGNINGSYAGGSVSGASNAGGLVGFNNGGTVSNSFWNTATSGQGSSNGGTGISTAQMLQAGTFGGAGWSIAASGGSTAVWRIYEGYTAPLLRSFMGVLTVSAGNVSKTYDGSTAINSNYTLSKSNADSSLILGTAASSTSSKNVGNYSIAVSGLYSGQQGYDLSFAAGTARVTAATLTVSGTAASNKTYDGTTAATLSGSLTGLVSGDAVALSQSGSFSDKNAATGKTVSYTNSLSGADAGNYALASASGTTTADINRAALTISGITAGDKTYNASDAATVNMTGVAYGGLVAGDAVAVVATGLFSDKNAGAGKTVNLSSSYSGADTGNYAITSQATTTASIRQAALTISGITAGDKTYNASDVATVNTAGAAYSGLITGDVVAVSATGLFSDKNAGAGKTVNLSSSYSGADVGNYAITGQATTTASISQASLTLSSADVVKTYDGSTSAAGVAVITGGALFGSDGLSGGSFAFTDRNAGAGNKTVTAAGVTVSDGNGGNNYNVSYVANTSSTINKASLTVTATGVNKVYDGSTAATVGLGDNRVAGDVLGITGAASFASQNAGLNKAVGVTGIAVSGADAGNYNLLNTVAATTADITPKALTVTANNDAQMGSIPYSGGSGVTYAGLVAGETAATVLTGHLAYSGNSQGAYLPGDYDITVGGLLANSNYTLGFVQGRLTLIGGDAATIALGSNTLAAAYQTSLNTLGGSGLLPTVSVDDGKGKGDGDAAAAALNAAAAEASQGGGE